jgi:hypothetical protein
MRAASIYWVGYNGPISEKGAINVIGSHHRPSEPQETGAYGAALIVDAFENNDGLAFLSK